MEKIYKIVATAFGAVFGYLWGWSPLIPTLLVLVILDYISGMMASFVEGRLSSRIGFKSIPKKIMIFFMIAVGHLIDMAFGETNMFRDATIFFYISNELLSITENGGRIGLPVPDKLTKAIEVLRGKSETKGDE